MDKTKLSGTLISMYDRHKVTANALNYLTRTVGYTFYADDSNPELVMVSQGNASDYFSQYEMFNYCIGAIDIAKVHGGQEFEMTLGEGGCLMYNPTDEAEIPLLFETSGEIAGVEWIKLAQADRDAVKIVEFKLALQNGETETYSLMVHMSLICETSVSNANGLVILLCEDYSGTWHFVYNDGALVAQTPILNLESLTRIVNEFQPKSMRVLKLRNKYFNLKKINATLAEYEEDDFEIYSVEESFPDRDGGDNDE